MSTITTKLETVTPQLAEKYLTFNVQNRSIRWTHVETMKQDILAGRWFTTHQGLAFGTDGNLIDGQHRLLAIKAAGRPVQILVTRGITPHVNGDINLYAMDVIDSGKNRSAADQLNLTHGVSNATLTVAALRRIIFICAPGASRASMTTSRAVPMLTIYGKEIERMIDIAKSSKLGRKASVVGVLSFAHKIDSALAEEFMGSLSTGESIKSGDPVYALRNHMIQKGVGAGAPGNDLFTEMVGNAFLNTIRGLAIKQVKAGASGLDFLRLKQRGNVEKVRAILFAK